MLEAVRNGQSRVLVVRGGAGIGKSALLRHLHDAAAGFRLLHATGVESEMELPFAALHQLCAPLLDRLDMLPEPQREAVSTAFGLTTGGPPERLLIGLAILNLLAAASDKRPVLCIVDDAQWLDGASVDTFTFVARRLLADRVALVFATRQEEVLAEFPEIRVEGLGESDAQTLLSTVLHVALDERVRDRIVAETRGNPLALVEWPRGLAPAELAGGFGMPSVLPIAGQIEESFRRRIAELPPPTQRFLTVAAAEPTGDPVLVWRAAGALDLGPGDASLAIDAGLIEIGFRVGFRHPLVRSAAYGSASLTERQAAHRELARATDPEADPDRQAWHRALGSPGPDEDIAQALERSAARARSRGGLAAAGALLERSLILTVDASRRADRALAAALAHHDAGSFEIAAGLMAAAEAIPLDEARRAQLDSLRAYHAINSGSPREAAALAIRSAQRLEPLDADAARGLYLQAMSAACVIGSLNDGAADLNDAALAASRCPPSSAPTPNDWLVVGLAQATIEGPVAASPALRRALAGTAGEPIDEHAIHLLGYRCAAASVLWDVDSLRELALLHIRATRATGGLSMLPTALTTHAQACILEGDLDAAASAVAEAAQIDAVTGNRFSFSVGAILAAVRGDEGAAALVDDQVSNARAAGLGLAVMIALWASATLYNSMGEYEKALAAAKEAMEHRWEWVGHVSFHELVEAAARCGADADAADALERLSATVDPNGSDWALGIQRRSQALLAEGSSAEDGYRDAIDRLGHTSIRPQLARTHLLYGEWLRRENRRVDARAQLRTAHEMFSGMGMGGFAERARRELLATGETVRKRSVDTLDELTPQEGLIARLAADGRTNAEIGTQLFISPRTAEWHLRKVFTKLGVTSRRDLRDALPVPG
jgi:DNA-binding CsgD family transcriptional regulator/tetratricopeptide (TPR) repeat protein